MSIQEHLNKIRNAIKGSEVRESIAKGIETAYDDASEKDNANMEVKMARGTNPNLSTRLNKMDEVDRQSTAQLAQTNQQKADRIYVDNLYSEIGSAKPSGAFPTLSDLESAYPNGDGNNYYVITEDNHWYYWNESSWVAGGLFNATVSDEFPATNYITNGDFSKGTEGWSRINSTISAANNILSIYADGTNGLTGINYPTNITSEDGKKVYIKARFKAYAENADGFRINAYVSDHNMHDFDVEQVGEWQEVSTIATLKGTGKLNVYLYARYFYSLPENGARTDIQYVTAIDLTNVFGVGREPSLEEMDEYMDRYQNRWFDGTVSPFLSQKELIVYQRNLEEDVGELKEGISLLNYRFDNLPPIHKKEPMPPTVTPELIPLGNVRFKFMELDGTMWGTRGSTVVKSTDGENWNDVLTIDFGQYGEIYAAGLMVTDTGRLLIGTMTGNVLVTNEEKTTYSLAFTFGGGGLFSNSLANKHYENYYFIGAYNSNATGNDYNNEVWMSKDYGATWDRVFIGEVINPNRNYHIHDIEYDPWEKRIYISVGDMENRNMFYSDNFGEGWVKLFDEFDEFGNLQPTQIIAYSHGVIFGSDDAEYGGLHYLPRRKGLNQPINKSDIIPDFFPIPNGPSQAPSFFAVKSFVLREGERQITLMPFRHMHYPGALSRLLVSENGLNWFEIWRAEKNDVGLSGGIYGTSDGKKAVGQYTVEGIERYLFVIDVPEFVMPL